MPIQITEAPRDALQGLTTFVPTARKVAYLRKLLAVGFAQLDCVSFVSPTVIPQLRDSAAVLAAVSDEVGQNKLLAIVANVRGAKAACEENILHSLGYPLSLSETFQQKNTRCNIKTALKELQEIQYCCQTTKQLLVFLSMGFGNPYGDTYNESVLLRMADHVQTMGVKQLSVADTVGLASPKHIERTLSLLLRHMPDMDISVHLHTTPNEARDKVAAAYQAGCKYFDAALHGYGGCPMASEKLIGNLSTQTLITYLDTQNESIDIDKVALKEASAHAKQLFAAYANH